MRCRLSLLTVVVALNGCTVVSSIQPLVADGSAIAEPRLLGDWQLTSADDTSLTQVQVTEVKIPGVPFTNTYAIRILSGSDTLWYEARLGPFTRNTWLLDVTAGDTARWGRYAAFLVPTYIQVVVERSASGLEFGFFNTDSLKVALDSQRLRTPFFHLPGDYVLTGEPAALRAALSTFAMQPGALVHLSREGHRLTIPKW